MTTQTKQREPSLSRVILKFIKYKVLEIGAVVAGVFLLVLIGYYTDMYIWKGSLMSNNSFGGYFLVGTLSAVLFIPSIWGVGYILLELIKANWERAIEKATEEVNQ